MFVCFACKCLASLFLFATLLDILEKKTDLEITQKNVMIIIIKKEMKIMMTMQMMQKSIRTKYYQDFSGLRH